MTVPQHSPENDAVSEGARDVIGFRNRYRTTDGSYRWLEWSGHATLDDGQINAVARDVTTQHEAEQQLATHSELLEAKVAERTQELNDARTKTLRRLALAAEYRDDDTFEHTERVGTLSAEIATHLHLDKDQVEILRLAAPLHDVGKIGIPDHILLKPGKLTTEEYEAMKTHTIARRPPAHRQRLTRAANGHPDRRKPPRALGRQRLPKRLRRRDDPPRRTHRRGRRRLRRPNPRPPL